MGLRCLLDTDASKYQIGCALFQTHEEEGRLQLGYLPSRLKDAELNYYVTEKAFLGVIYGITNCRHYLIGEDFDLHTDQAALRWLFYISYPSGRQMRWRIRLSEFTFRSASVAA